ncbi:MAG TPA: hypothetical protein PKA85_01575, partial [Ferruginibacter sp.]|nr:hypothetical protein [Ferruginibacter sp.]
MKNYPPYHVLIVCSDNALWKLWLEVWMQTIYKDAILKHVEQFEEAARVFHPGEFQLILFGHPDAAAYDKGLKKYIRHVPLIGFGFPEKQIHPDDT